MNSDHPLLQGSRGMSAGEVTLQYTSIPALPAEPSSEMLWGAYASLPPSHLNPPT
jgi:hypothetical protein